MENVTCIHLPQVDSTNNFVREMVAADGNSGCESACPNSGMTVVTTDMQTAGRGQTGNTWESERGKNLLFSLLCHPTFMRPSQQFALSECIALAVRKALSLYVEGVEVKWPNDIYVDNRKISGTLIECDLMGRSISKCVIGTGININQEVFRSDAPNPVSLKQLTGKDYDREEILSDVIREFRILYERLKKGEAADIHEEYKRHLFRRCGMHRYADVRGEFMAEIADVEPTGHLLLRFEGGNVIRYEFKEVRAII